MFGGKHYLLLADTERGLGIFCPEELRKSSKKLSQDSRSPGRKYNPGPLIGLHKTDVLTAQSRCSVVSLWLPNMPRGYAKFKKPRTVLCL